MKRLNLRLSSRLKNHLSPDNGPAMDRKRTGNESGRLLSILNMFLMLITFGVGNVWGEKITAYGNIVSGTKYYIGATTGGNDYYFQASGGISEGTGYSGVAVSSTSDATPVTFTGSGTSWTITFSNGKYLKLNSSDANGKYDVSSSSSSWTLSNVSSLIHMENSSHVFQKNNSSTAFASYKTTSSQTDIWLEEAPANTEAYTVSFVTGTGNPSQDDIAETNPNDGVTLPNVTPTCSGDGWAFYGWATTSCSSSTTAPPAIVGKNGDTYYPSDDVTLYAVYRKLKTGSTTTTYTINSTTWGSSNGNWTVADGSSNLSYIGSKYGLSSSTSSIATSPSAYSDISSVVFTGTKSDKGAGSVEFFYKSGSKWTTMGSKSFGTSLTWSPSPNLNGQLKIKFTRTNGNIYVTSIAVTYKTYDYYSTPTCCENLGSINGSFK